MKRFVYFIATIAASVSGPSIAQTPAPTPPGPPIGVNIPAIHATCKLLTANGEVVDVQIDTSAYSNTDSNGSWKKFTFNSGKRMPFDGILTGEMKYNEFDDGIATFNITGGGKFIYQDEYYIRFVAYRHSDAVALIYRIETIKIDENRSIGRNHYYASGYCRSSYNTERK